MPGTLILAALGGRTRHGEVRRVPGAELRQVARGTAAAALRLRLALSLRLAEAVAAGERAVLARTPRGVLAGGRELAGGGRVLSAGAQTVVEAGRRELAGLVVRVLGLAGRLVLGLEVVRVLRLALVTAEDVVTDERPRVLALALVERGGRAGTGPVEVGTGNSAVEPGP